MNETFVARLQQLGLSTAEAQIYTTLLNKGPLGASAIAHLTGLQRANVYPILWSLGDKGLIEGGAGYGAKFTAVLPDQALPSLIVREREMLAQRERFASELAEQMAALVSPTETATEELIQVIRHPKVIADRFERLQSEAEWQVDGFVKAPFFTRDDNPSQTKALQRGVRYRCLYERAVVEDSVIKPFIQKWIEQGQEARIHHGKLPQKLAIFDKQAVLMPLMMPGDQTRALLIRHPELALSLSMFFESLWERAEPLLIRRQPKSRKRPAWERPGKTRPGKKPTLAKLQKVGTGGNGSDRRL
jgi:sugar-specific transcriptional regulator TrmB